MKKTHKARITERSAGAACKPRCRKEERTMKSREEYIDTMTKQLKEWSARIDELESRIGTVRDDMKTTYEQRIRDMKEKRDQAVGKLQELRSASGDAWKTLTAGMDSAWDDLKITFKQAKEKLKKAA